MKKHTFVRIAWYLPILHIIYPLLNYINHLVEPAPIPGSIYGDLKIDLAIAQVGGITALLLIIGLYGWFYLFHLKKTQDLSRYFAILLISVLLPWVPFIIDEHIRSWALFYYMFAIIGFVIVPWILVMTIRMRKS